MLNKDPKQEGQDGSSLNHDLNKNLDQEETDPDPDLKERNIRIRERIRIWLCA